MDWKVRAMRQFLWLGIILVAIRYGAAEQRVVCYYTNWSVYRPGTAKFSPQNINPYLCTHLIYAFGGFTKENALKPFDKYQDIEKGGYAKFNGLKTYNKNLKTMLAIGGWNEGSSRFSPMVADPKRRKEFVKNAVKFLRQNHFDGLDLDWEYPAFRDGGKARDKENYANLVQELGEEFDRESSKTGRARLLLSMAIPAGIEYIDKGYDIPRLNEYLDFFNLLSYDYHSAFEPAVNHHSPLYPLEEESEYNYDGELTIDFTINHLLKQGASSDKIVLGIPTYGRSYTLYNEEATEIGSPADGPGEEGDATREKGYLAYYEICESVMNSDDWEVVQPNPNAMGPYAYKGNQWVGYDDEEIVRQKARYVNEKNLGGIMFWSIDNDDFRGKCHDRPYPLIEAAKETLLSGNEKTQSTQKGKTTDGEKKIRTQGIQGNLVGRKVPSGEGRRTTTLSSVSKKRPLSTKPRNRPGTRLDSNEEIPSVDPLDANEDEDDSRLASNAVRSLESADDNPKKNKPRGKNRRRPGSQGGRKRLRNPNVEKASQASDSEVSSSNKLTTPEPPTTPDPGSDFKCEDEGFFSHPRDCKKYFWCLDSGPSGLGIVAHQFTCPSGLVFNKAADSCDYPRNVRCPKSKTSSGTVVTTTRAPITAATSRTTYLHSTTQRTTTSISDSLDDEEYYDDEEDEEEDEEDEPVSTTTARALLYKTISRTRPTTTSTRTSTTTTTEPVSTTKSYQSAPERSRTTQSQNTNEDDPEEDPRVIQELIDLIKKAGGIEQLEKQLLLQEKNFNSGTTSSSGNVTPATISRSLYERVLNRQSTKGVNKLFGSPKTISRSSTTTEPIVVKDDEIDSKGRTNFRNGPGRSQFEGLDDLPEVQSLRRAKKPQYVTIERQRPSTRPADSEEETGTDVQEEEDSANVASSEEKAISNPPEVTDRPHRVTPSYVNIRRTRPTTAKGENDVEEKVEDASDLRPNFRKRRPTGSKTTEDAADDTIRPNFRNRRPTTPKNDPENDDDDDDEDDVEEDDEGKKLEEDQNVRTVAVQEETPTTKSRYISINRFRSTTVSPSESPSSESVPISESTVEITKKFTATSPITEAATNEAASESPVFLTTTTTTTTTTEIPTTTPISISSSEASTVTVSEPPNESTLLPKISSTNRYPENESSVKLVEESATEILLTTAEVSDTSNQGASSYEPLTKGTTVAVSQPRPFGFPRRTRPTVSISVTPSTEATTPIVPVTQVRQKVASDTFRLPTLKELVGYRTVDTREYTTSAPTTSIYDIDKEPDTTVPPDFEKPEHPQDPRENLIEKGSSHVTSDPDPETTITFTTVSSPLTSEPMTTSTMTTTTTTTTTSAPPIPKNNHSRLRYVKRVDVPVRIVDESGDGPFTELILRVPEDKLNSAVLKSILRVEVIDPSDQSERDKKFRIRKPLPRTPLRTTATATTVKPVTVRGNRVTLPRTEFATRGFYVTKTLQRNALSSSGTVKPSSTTEFVRTEIPATTEPTVTTSTTANNVNELSTDTLKKSETKSFVTSAIPETTFENNYSTVPNAMFTRMPESTDVFTTPLVTVDFASSDPTSTDGAMKTTYSRDATTLMHTRVTETDTVGTNSTQTVSMIYDSEMKTVENEFVMEEHKTTVPISETGISFLQTTDAKTERNPTTFYQTDPYTMSKEGDTTFFEKIDTKTEKNPTTVSMHTDPYTMFNEEDRSFLGNIDDNAEIITTTIIKTDPYVTTSQSNRDLATERTSLFNNIVTTDRVTMRNSAETIAILNEIEEEKQKTSLKTDTTSTTELFPNVISTTTESAQFDIDTTIEFVQSSINTSTEPIESGIGTTKPIQPDTETIKSVESNDITAKELLESSNEMTKKSVPTSIPTTTESVQLNVEATTEPAQSIVETAEVSVPSGINATTESIYSSIGTTVSTRSSIGTITESIRPSIETTTESVQTKINTTTKSTQAITEVVQESANASNIRSNEIEQNTNFSRSGTQSFIRRRVINRTTDKVDDDRLHVNPNGARRRVIFRTRGRTETSTRTDDVQSSSVASVETPDRKLKPRRRTVLKRMRLRTSGIEKGSDLPEENSENNDGSVRVQDLEARSNQKNTDLEVNFFKNSANGARRPGTLVRPSTTSRTLTRTSSLPDDISDALIRRHKLRPGDSGLKPTTKSIIRTINSQKQDKDDALVNDDLEVEKHDQSIRAQEVAVTVTQPPSQSAPTATGRPPFRTALRRRISTTQAPRTVSVTTVSTPTTTSRAVVVRRRQRPLPYEKIVENLPNRPRHRPIIDYDYYEDEEERVIGKPKLSGKLFITGRGGIRCLDQGNFPHPTSCKKFITCARMVSGQVIGTEYTCPDKLSFDPVGEICNWSAGLGCKE